MSRRTRYWLMKSEPSNYSISDLKKDRRSLWDGVRNYQARNFMMKDMKVGDKVLFYHSNAFPSGVYGLARVSAPAQADLTALDPKSQYFDSKATPENPRWFCVEVQFEKQLKKTDFHSRAQKSPYFKKHECFKKRTKTLDYASCKK